MGNNLGIGFGDELVTLRGELALEVEVVLDNAVVHHDDAARAVAMWVGVLFSWAAMGGPARVADTEGPLQRIFAQNLFKVGKLSGRAAEFERGAGRVADRDACRVVSAIFEPPQPFNNDGDDLLRANITNNSAHETILCEESGAHPAEMRHAARTREGLMRIF